MLEQNQKIVLSGEKALDALKEIEFILVSLHNMGSFYAEKPGAVEEYRKATTDFIDNCAVTQRLAKVRTIISEHFDDSLGDDDMDDTERHFSGLEFWKPERPLTTIKYATEILEISRGTIQQVTCKRDELLVVFTNQQDEFIVITFHNVVAFKGISAIGAELCDIEEGTDVNFSREAQHLAPIQNKKNYCFKSKKQEERIFTVVADGYSTERI